MKKYTCSVCSYIYDSAEGDSENGIAPGTPFENLADSWTCPVCGASKGSLFLIKAMGVAILEDFQEFAMRGNVVDMAVGIVIGAAFGTIVKSFVDDVLMPPIGLLLGNVDFSNLFLILKEGSKAAGPYASLVALPHLRSYFAGCFASRIMLPKADYGTERRVESEVIDEFSSETRATGTGCTTLSRSRP